MRCAPVISVLWICAAWASSSAPEKLSPTVLKYVAVNTPRVVLNHVRVIDGTGAPAVLDRSIVLERATIVAIDAKPVAQPRGAAKDTTVIDLSGRTVVPGIVGMHNHLFYIVSPNADAGSRGEPPVLVPQMSFSAPRLYLAGGVTTMRTTGSVEPYADLNLRDAIEAGELPGPHIDVTGPYIEGTNSRFLQMPRIATAAEARDFVNYWADRGVTSFKAYMNISRAELQAAIEAAHKRGIKVTGHLCSITYPEAAELGIDNLEHGFFVNTQLDPDKKPEVCPESAGTPTLQSMEPGTSATTELFSELVRHHVAITSTLPVFEDDIMGRAPLRQEMLDVFSPQAREAWLIRRARLQAHPPHDDFAALLKRDMALERAFVAAGGLLLSGPDPTGGGGVVPGFGDQRGIELLVEAGFSPVEAIRIATLNGAIYLGRDQDIGSVAVGKHADLVVIKGDPSQNIRDIEKIELVFKDGVGYDPRKLLESVRGKYGQY